MSAWLSDPGFWGGMRLLVTLVVAISVVRHMARRRGRADADGRQRSDEGPMLDKERRYG